MPSGDPNGPPALPQLQHLFARYGRNDLVALTSSPSYETSYLDSGADFNDSDLAPLADPYVPFHYNSVTPPIIELDIQQPPSVSAAPPQTLTHDSRIPRHPVPKYPLPKISPTSANSHHFFSDHEPVVDERSYYASYPANMKKTNSPGILPLGYSPATVTYSMMPQKPDYSSQYHSMNQHQQHAKLSHVTHRVSYPPTHSGAARPQYSSYDSSAENTYGTGFNELIVPAYSQSTDSYMSDTYLPSDDFDVTTPQFIFE